MAAASNVYGCHNHPPYKTTRWIQDGWDIIGTLADGHQQRAARFIQITVEAPTECQHTKTELGQKDPRCTGCNYRR